MVEFSQLDKQSIKPKGELKKLYKLYIEQNLNPTPKEKMIINPKVAYHVSEQDLLNSIPFDEIKSVKEIYGGLSKISKEDPVRNLHWDYLYFVDSDYFRPAAIAFEKSEKEVAGTKIKPSYTKYIKGTKSYNEFWEEEFKRINYGYEPIVDGKPCGLRISGEYYFYLNYCRIIKVEKNSAGRTVTRENFPSFLTMDYYYFKELEARENPHLYGFDDDFKRSICLVKARRLGYSFKAASGCVWVTAFNENARVGIASEPNTRDATDAVKCARKCLPIIDHLTNYTPFGRKPVGNPKFNGGWSHIKNKNRDDYFSFTFGIENTKNREQRGRTSTIFTMSLSKDDAASGEGLNRLYFEEAGKIHNLDKAWVFSRESMKAGSLFRGLAIIFGCVTENNDVWDENGKPVNIKNLKEGNKLLGYSKSSELASVEDISYKAEVAKKPCVKITTKLGHFIECSKDHPILWSHRNYRYSHRETVNNKRIFKGSVKKAAFHEAGLIKEGEQIAIINKIDRWGNKEMFDPYLIGLLIGNGSYGYNKTPVLSFQDQCVYNYLINSNYDITVEKSKTTKEGKIYREIKIKKITKYLRELCIYGHTKLDKRLPQDIYNYNKQNIIKLIKGLYDSDGGISDNGNFFNIHLTSSSKELLIQVRKQLYKLGIHTSLAKIKPSNRNRKIKDINECHRLVISDKQSLAEYYNTIGFQVEYKFNKLKECVIKYKTLEFDKKSVVMPFKHLGYNKKELIDLSNIRFDTVVKIEDVGEKEIYNLTADTTNTYLVNNIITHNTGGSMISDSGAAGSSKAFSEIFMNPIASEVAAYDNIYEYKKTNDKCGYFVCSMWGQFGGYVKINGKKYEAIDKMGNAHFWVAELSLNKTRHEKMPPKGTQKDYNQFLTQKCKTPSEAFLVSSSNIFNSAELIARVSKIKTENGGFEKYRTPGELIEDHKGNIVFQPDSSLVPITGTNYDTSSREGCLLVYEHPSTIGGTIPNDAYIISVDPIANNNSGGKSLNAIIVYKTNKYIHELGEGKIVATYFGRRDIRPLDYLHNILIKLSKYYNAKITYENDRDGGILKHFTYTNNLHRLMLPPLLVTKKYLPNSKTLLREFGHSMGSEKLKSIGESYLNEWLDYRHSNKKVLNENAEVIEVIGKRNMDLIYDELILDELINYNRKGNFDSTMALMGLMVQLEDKFGTDQGVLYNNEYINKIDKSIVSYIRDNDY